MSLARTLGLTLVHLPLQSTLHTIQGTSHEGEHHECSYDLKKNITGYRDGQGHGDRQGGKGREGRGWLSVTAGGFCVGPDWVLPSCQWVPMQSLEPQEVSFFSKSSCFFLSSVSYAYWVQPVASSLFGAAACFPRLTFTLSPWLLPCCSSFPFSPTLESGFYFVRSLPLLCLVLSHGPTSWFRFGFHLALTESHTCWLPFWIIFSLLFRDFCLGTMISHRYSLQGSSPSAWAGCPPCI